MDKSRLQIKVGLFVFIGLILLAVLIIQFSKSTSVFRGTYELNLHAVNVGGLKEQAGVQLAGVRVGTVSKITLADDGKSVTILLKVYKNFRIYHDARFVIEQSGFLGDQFVSIIPTTNTPPWLENGASVECQEPFNLQEVARSASGFIQRIDETAKKLDASVTDLQRVVLSGQTLTNFATSIENVRTFTEQAMGTINDVNALISTNSEQIKVAVSNVVVFSQQLNLAASRMDGILATNSPDITLAVKNIASSTETLKNLMNNIQAGKGLAGTLLQNQELATNVQSIANNLAITSSNLNRRGLWGILWAHKPPPTNAPATTDK